MSQLIGIGNYNFNNEPSALSQYYPNPFSNEVNIVFNLQSTEDINLAIYNIYGQKVISLADCKLPAGEHTIKWGGNNSSGSIVKPGMYLYRIQVNNQVETKRIMFTGKGK